MGYQSFQKHRIATARIVAVYTLFGLTWIYGSNTVLGWLVHDPAMVVKIAVIKGSLFILCTATLLFFLINRFVRQIVAAENQHIESLTNYEAIFNATNESIFVHDAQSGHILDVNNRMLETFGYERDEALKMDIVDVSEGTPPYSNEEAVAKVRKAMLEGPQVFEWLCRKKTGELFWSEVSLKRFSVHDYDRILAVVRDISDRKRSEEAIKKSEGKFSKAFNACPALISIATMDDGKYIDVNDLFLASTGYQKNEVIGHTSTELGFWIDASEREKYLNHLDTYCSLKDYEAKYRMRNNEVRDFLVSSELIEIDGKRCSLSFKLDVTERKKSEEAVRKSENEFRMLAESMPQIVWICSPDGLNIYFNQQWVEYTGLSLEESYGNNWIKPFHPDDQQKAWDAWQNATKYRVTYSLECRLRRADGVYKWWLTRGVPILDESGAILKWFGTCTDIDEFKKADEEKLALQQQLLHAQKLESLGILAGGIAHDFNNILTSIVGNADLALMKINKESPAVDNLRKVEQAAARATDLTKQMLAYSGKGKFVVEHLNLSQLLEEILNMLELIISKKVVLRLNLTPDLPSVEADATQIRQIIMNLVINASEAIGDKSGVIAISTGCIDCDKNYLKDVWLHENIREGLYVYLEIADTGCGMDKATQAKIFDPFFTTKFTGRGLGMAALLGIVKGHKGAIKIYSEPMKGTTIKVLLPASDRPAMLDNRDNHQGDLKGGGKVLLVDDEENVRGICKEMLRELGFTAITANDGREAINVFKTTPDIAFVILDLTMPHLDGEQCFRELKQLKPDVKVILSSGYNEVEVTHKFVGKGLAGFIQKPYKLSDLRNIILQLFRD